MLFWTENAALFRKDTMQSIFVQCWWVFRLFFFFCFSTSHFPLSVYLEFTRTQKTPPEKYKWKSILYKQKFELLNFALQILRSCAIFFFFFFWFFFPTLFFLHFCWMLISFGLISNCNCSSRSLLEPHKWVAFTWND